MKTVHFEVEKIQTEGLQSRAEINRDVVREYAEASTAGGAFLPPITVFKDDAGNLFCADGFHRLAAAQATGQTKVAAVVQEGSRIDALRYALGANQAHGLRRTPEDKKHAVMMAYQNRKQLGLPDVPAARLIAEIVGVHHSFVESQLATVASWNQAPARTGADGKTRERPPIPTRRPTADGTKESAPPPPVRPSDTPPQPHRTQQLAEIDELGRDIPEGLLPVWNRRQEVQDAATIVSKIRTMIRAAQDGQDPLWSEISFFNVLNNLDRAYSEIAAAKPYCVCPMCQGIGCKTCKDSGLISKFRHDRFVPAEFKKGN